MQHAGALAFVMQAPGPVACSICTWLCSYMCCNLCSYMCCGLWYMMLKYHVPLACLCSFHHQVNLPVDQGVVLLDIGFTESDPNHGEADSVGR